MGLDIYLEYAPDQEQLIKAEEEYEIRSSAIWDEYGPYESLTDEQKDEARSRNNAIAAELGLGEWGSAERAKIEIPSMKYPDHLFKVGYFRSSYNDGGINSVFRRLGIPDLYDIFTVDHDEGYYIQPDWKASLDRAEEVRKQFVNKRKDDGDFDCFEVSPNMFNGKPNITSESDALRVFKETIERGSSYDHFSNAEGQFMTKGFEVYALIPGIHNIFSGEIPCTYVVYKNTEGFDHYEHAIEIVIETIEYVLAQPDPQHYYLAWSG